MVRFIRCIACSLRELVARDRRGGTATLIAMTAVPLIGFFGIAVDSGRGYMVKSKLQHALDAAALVGGKAIEKADRDAQIQMFFNANFPTGYLNATITGPVIDVDATNGLVTLSASATFNTSFMTLFGVDTMTASARTVARRATRGMELVLIMDNTGSMRSSGKIDSMKSAATDLINILYGINETVDDFYVGVVPYTATVNVGSQRIGWLTSFDPSAFTGTVWKGCVVARPAPDDTTDERPALAGFEAQAWPSTLGLPAGDVGDNDWDAANIDETNGAQNNGLGPNLGCGPAITPLVAERTTVLAAIAEMEPWHRGGTMANLGLAWGWRVISPQWQGLWGGASPAFLPLDYDTPLMDKVVILLTDGVNQWYDWPGGLPGKCSPCASGNGPTDADYTAYRRLSEGELNGATSNGAATTEINNRMLSLCSAMKNEGVIIYAITFKLNSSSTKQLYEDCSTSPTHYFDSPSNSDLQAVFAAIGEELSNLRIAQ